MFRSCLSGRSLRPVVFEAVEAVEAARIMVTDCAFLCNGPSRSIVTVDQVCHTCFKRGSHHFFSVLGNVRLATLNE